MEYGGNTAEKMEYEDEIDELKIFENTKCPMLEQKLEEFHCTGKFKGFQKIENPDITHFRCLDGGYYNCVYKRCKYDPSE